MCGSVDAVNYGAKYLISPPRKRRGYAFLYKFCILLEGVMGLDTCAAEEAKWQE